MALHLVFVRGNINWFGTIDDNYLPMEYTWVLPLEDREYYPLQPIRVFHEDVYPAVVSFVGLVGIADNKLYHYPLHPWSQ